MWWATAIPARPRSPPGCCSPPEPANRLLRVDEGNTITDFDEEEIPAQNQHFHRHRRGGMEEDQDQYPRYSRLQHLYQRHARLPGGGRCRPWCWWMASPASRCRPRRSGTSPTISSSPAPWSSTSWTASAPILSAPWKACRRAFGRAAVPIQIPIGAERDFTGVVDLVRMKAYTYTADGDGKGKEGEIPADLADCRQGRSRSADRNGGRGQRRPDGRILRQGHAGGRADRRRPASRPSARCASSPCSAPPALHNIAQRPDPQFHRRKPARPHRARRLRERRRRRRIHAEDRRDRPCLRCSSSRPRPTPSPAASPISRSSPAWSRTTPALQNLDAQHVRAAGPPQQPAGQDPATGHRTARRRYRRGRQAEGHADRRHPGATRASPSLTPR